LAAVLAWRHPEFGSKASAERGVGSKRARDSDLLDRKVRDTQKAARFFNLKLAKKMVQSLPPEELRDDPAQVGARRAEQRGQFRDTSRRAPRVTVREILPDNLLVSASIGMLSDSLLHVAHIRAPDSF
jgi:hypothetical protein